MVVLQASVAPAIANASVLPAIPGAQLQLLHHMVNTSFGLPQDALDRLSTPQRRSLLLHSSGESTVPHIHQRALAAADPCNASVIAARASAVARALGLPPGNVTITCASAAGAGRRRLTASTTTSTTTSGSSGACDASAVWSISLTTAPTADLNAVSSGLSR